MREKLRAFITSQIMRSPQYALRDDESLIKGGLIDSFSLVELALFIEQEFGVHFDDPELTADNMDTLDQMMRNIEAKL
jgi:acyl carrier protein